MSRLLIVEDEMVIAMLLEELVSTHGHEVVGQASTGKEAVEMARAFRPDLVLMDILLPGAMDGIAACELIRHELGIPSIFITGHTRDDLLRRASAVEHLGYIVKPFNEKQLLAVIELASARDQLEQSASGGNPLRSDPSLPVHPILAALEKRLERLERLIDQRGETGALQGEVLPEKRPDSGKEHMEEPGLARRILSRCSTLTPAETRVACLLIQGLTTKAMAELLCVSEGTVQRHREHIRKKLGLTARGQNLRGHLLSLLGG